jgi:hypothetical protein
MTELPDRDDVAIVVGGLEQGVWRLSEVKAWADSYIATAAEPAPTWLIDCSLSKHSLDARSALLPWAAESPLLNDAEIALALLAERVKAGALGPREATRAAFRLVVERKMSGDLANVVYYLDDAFDLADARIQGSSEATEREAVDFFRNTVRATASAKRLKAFLRGRGRFLRGSGGGRTKS